MPTDWLAVIILCACGAAISTQATVNVAFGRSVGLWVFATAFTVIQLVATLPTFFALGWPVRWPLFAEMPWWQFIGGVLGMPVLAGMSFAIGRTGTFAGLAALLVGQLTTGLLIDRFGLFNAPVHPITWQRLLGFVLMIVAVILSKQ